MTIHSYTARQVLEHSPVVPVMVIDDLNTAIPLARALVEGGIRVLEITLRTAVALDAIRQIANEVEGAIVGAGTVLNPGQYEDALKAGAQFVISPGISRTLLEATKGNGVPLIPGVATISEIMLGLEGDLDAFKFFPAEAAGGIPMLKSIAGPLPDVRFCPTGGITPSNYLDYLALPSVSCVGGSWLAPKAAIQADNYAAITELAREAVEGARPYR